MCAVQARHHRLMGRNSASYMQAHRQRKLLCTLSPQAIHHRSVGEFDHVSSWPPKSSSQHQRVQTVRVTIIATRKQGTGPLVSGVFAVAKREYANIVSIVGNAQIALNNPSLTVQKELNSPE